MRRLAGIVAILVALPVSAQGWGKVATGWTKISNSGYASLPSPSLADAGKVPAVNVGGTAYELIAVGGTGTVTSVGNGTIGALFAASWATETTTPAFSLNLATQAANCVIAGPATGANAVPTCRALVAADLGSFTLAPSLKLLTLQDATGDTTPLTVRASSGVGTAHIAQFQASDNSPLSHIAHDGSFVGAVIGNASTATTAGAVTTVVASKLLGRGSAGGDGVSQDITLGTNLSMSGTTLNAAGGGGITNSAGANVLAKSDGTNIVASTITDDGTTLTGTGSGGINFTNANAAYKISVSGQPVLSISRDGSVGGLNVSSDATKLANFGLPALNLGSTYQIGWSNGVVSQPIDMILRRRAAANPAWGKPEASPVAYTHNFAADARAGTDTNVGGANATLLPGIGTGTGAASRLLLGGPILGTTGSAAQTTATPVSIGGEVKADGTESFLNVTGTLPASPSAGVAGVSATITGAGTASQTQTGAKVSLAAGYTGNQASYGISVSNATVGTGIDANGNIGLSASAGNAASDTYQAGVVATAASSNTNGQSHGVIGYVTTGRRRTGVYGFAVIDNSAQYGGAFTIGTSGTFPSYLPAGNAAVLAGNGATTYPIFLGYDNTTQVFAVNDGGGVTMYREIEANTAGSGTPNALAATESHKVLTNEGATALNYHTLPTAAKGLTYTFVVQDTDGIRVTAGADDTIRVAATVTAAAGYITSSTIGDTVTLVAINAVEWVAVSALGTWTAGP